MSQEWTWTAYIPDINVNVCPLGGHVLSLFCPVIGHEKS